MQGLEQVFSEKLSFNPVTSLLFDLCRLIFERAWHVMRVYLADSGAIPDMVCAWDSLILLSCISLWHVRGRCFEVRSFGLRLSSPRRPKHNQKEGPIVLAEDA